MDKFYDEGKDAFLTDIPRYDNPYEFGSDAHRDWQMGWDSEEAELYS